MYIKIKLHILDYNDIYYLIYHIKKEEIELFCGIT